MSKNLQQLALFAFALILFTASFARSESTVCAEVSLDDSDYGYLSDFSSALESINSWTSNGDDNGISIIIKGDFSVNSFYEAYGTLGIGLIVVLVVSFVVNFFLCCCCCCCLFTKERRLQTERSKNWKYLCWALFIGAVLGLAAICVSGFFYSSKFVTSFKKASCSVYDSVLDINEGLVYNLASYSDSPSSSSSSDSADTVRWVGLTDGESLLANLGVFFDYFYEVDASSLNKEWSVEIEQANATAKATYLANKDSTVDSPASDSTDLVTPIIVDDFTPFSDSSSFFGSVFSELYDFTSLGVHLVGTYEISITNSSYDTQLAAGQEELNYLSGKVGDLETSMGDTIDQIFDAGGGGIIVTACSLFLFACALLIVSIFFLCCVVSNVSGAGKLQKCSRISMYICWLTFALLTIFVIILTGALVLLKEFTNDSCEIVADVSYDKEFLDDLQLDKSISDFLTVCLFSDGDLLKYFGVSSETDNYDYIATTIDLYLELVPDENGTSLASVETNIEVIASYSNFSTTGFTSEDESEDPESLMAALNSWADASLSDSLQLSSGNCEISFDEIVFDSGLCPDGKDVYQSGDGIGSEICVPMDVLDESYSSRYKSTSYSSCDVQVDQYIRGYYQGLNGYRSSLLTLLDNILGDLQAIQTDFETTSSMLETCYDYVVEIDGKRGDVDADLGGQSIRENFNCDFADVLIQRISNQLCEDSIDDLKNLTAVYIAFTVLLLLFQIVLFALAFLAFKPHANYGSQ